LNNEALPETGINTDNFWSKFDEAVHQLAPINKKLIKTREETQKKIDEWHISKKGIQIN
jgi:malate synthase